MNKDDERKLDKLLRRFYDTQKELELQSGDVNTQAVMRERNLARQAVIEFIVVLFERELVADGVVVGT